MASEDEREEAAERELEQRNRDREAEMKNASAVDWGAAAGLSERIKQNVIRLGGKPTADGNQQGPLDTLVHGIVWPAEEYRSSTDRFRALLTQLGAVGYDDEDDEILEDIMPHRTIDFAFLSQASSGSFWDGWESEFEQVDPGTQFPIGSDGHYFLLIAENPDDPSDPLLLTVDHEEVNEEPFHPDEATLGHFLATLEFTGVAREEE